MKFEELKLILFRLYREYVRKHFIKIFFFITSINFSSWKHFCNCMAFRSSCKKIFIDQDKTLSWLIPCLIILAFSTKGISLYFAKLNILKVSSQIAGELQKKIANNILLSDIQTLDNRHSGKYISNILFDTGQVKNLVGVGVLNLMKDPLFNRSYVSNVLSKLEISFICYSYDASSCFICKKFRKKNW